MTADTAIYSLGRLMFWVEGHLIEPLTRESGVGIVTNPVLLIGRGLESTNGISTQS